jgi:hypothetical protein
MKRFPLLVSLFLLLLLVPAGVAVEDTPAPHLFSASPSSAPNTDTHTVTITLSGSGFVPGIKGAIYPCFSTPQYSTVTYWSPSTVTLTYSFYGQTTGTWHIRLQNPDGDVTEVTPFSVYGTSTTTTTTTTTTETTTTVTTTTSAPGENSVFFDTNPSGARIFLNGEEVGMSAFIYYTNREGTFDVVAKKTGYEDYVTRITILEGKRVHYYYPLTPLFSTTTAGTTAVTTTVPGTPVSTVTTIQKSTLKIPTPLGTAPPLPQESPADPAIALWAAGIGIIFVVIRRR